MQINADALSSVKGFACTVVNRLIVFRSLQIFDTEAHATVQSDKTKEGLSLFGELRDLRFAGHI